MKTLSADVTTEKNAEQSAWCEVYDIYLKAPISTPFDGSSIDVIRITTRPGGLSFFTPLIDPEDESTRGDAATYQFWPITREIVRGDRKTTNDKMTVAFSNVTGEWATMLAGVDWSDVPIVIRLVPTSVATLASDDCVVLFTGLVDSEQTTLELVQFTLSNDLGSLASIAPRENMHSACRFKWGDDLCTTIKHHAENYNDTKVVGASSTTTRVKSANLTEDAGSAASYGTDIVDALADGSITTSSEQVGYTNIPVTCDNTHNTIALGSGQAIGVNEEVVFNATGSMPTGLTAGVTYYVRYVSYAPTGARFSVTATIGGSAINFTTTGVGVQMTTRSYEGFSVKSSNDGYWMLPNDTDWGTLSHGYWQLPDAQAGLKNAALKPYLQFDFGSAKTPRLWRVASVENVSKLEDLARLIVFFSSADATNWVHESYFEIPPRGGELFDVLIPKASTARYWRICIRSRWAVTFSPFMLSEVRAYENGRHWWARGQIKFTSGALNGLSRRILESYNGEVVVAPLPSAPAAADTFIIQRGCPRTFNGCAERRNVENFGGFTTLPEQTIIR